LKFVHVGIKPIFTACLHLFERAFKVDEYHKIGTYDSTGEAMEDDYSKNFSISASGALTLENAAVQESGR